MTLTISNRQARRLFLERHALCLPHASAPELPFGPQQTLELVQRLGFVQLDSINAVERAHHLILFSRAPAYRREYLRELHQQQAALFEHWTHDAALIPSEFYPHWRHRFRSARERLKQPRWLQRLGADGPRLIRQVRSRVRRHGAVMARDFEDKGSGAWWGWGPSKTALEYLWRSGELAIARREGFEKVYDLSERVIPESLRQHRPRSSESERWFCEQALQRLGFATASEIAAFWQQVPVQRVKAWAAQQVKQRSIRAVNIEAADGSIFTALAFSDIEQQLAALPEVPPVVRFLSPFDPLIRDRRRALRLFGFDYRLEVFVPEAQRRYGYYVLPLLHGDRFIARADVKLYRDARLLQVKGFWPEPGLNFDRHRGTRIRDALTSLADFTGASQIDADAIFSMAACAKRAAVVA